jgi:uncharacterized lipoprotein YddW (UPF0748 family)
MYTYLISPDNYRLQLYTDTALHMWTVGWLGQVNTINKPIKNGNWQMSDKRMGLGIVLQQETVRDSTSLKWMHFALHSHVPTVHANAAFITILKHAFHKITCQTSVTTQQRTLRHHYKDQPVNLCYPHSTHQTDQTAVFNPSNCTSNHK